MLLIHKFDVVNYCGSILFVTIYLFSEFVPFLGGAGVATDFKFQSIYSIVWFLLPHGSGGWVGGLADTTYVGRN